MKHTACIPERSHQVGVVGRSIIGRKAVVARKADDGPLAADGGNPGIGNARREIGDRLREDFPIAGGSRRGVRVEVESRPVVGERWCRRKGARKGKDQRRR